jgi:hypothetical protein
MYQIPDAVRKQRFASSGIDKDGWVRKKSLIALPNPDGSRTLVIRGLVPRVDREDYATEMTLKLDGSIVLTRRLGLGDFEIRAPVAGSPGVRHVELSFSRTQVLPKGDGRSVGARISEMGFGPAGLLQESEKR